MKINSYLLVLSKVVFLIKTQDAGCAFLLLREDLRQVGDKFAGGLALMIISVPDPLQTSPQLALLKNLIHSSGQRNSSAS